MSQDDVKYTVEIQQDDDDPRSCMICILLIQGSRKNIIGIPARGLNYRDASIMAAPIRFAFEFGLREMQEELIKSMGMVANSVGVS